MGIFDAFSHHKDSYDAVTDEKKRKGSITHELIAGAAAYEAAKAFEKHQAEQGKVVSHEKAKELLAAFSGAFIDHMVETKGLDFIDKQKAKREAAKHTEEALDPSQF